MMMEETGVPTNEDLIKVIPSKQRLAKGPVAVIECFQNIPCDPCSALCRREAIRPFKNINELPQIDFDKCNGCGSCTIGCPGSAIFVLNETYSDKEAIVMIPYEFLPLPKKGEEVYSLNREGENVGKVRVMNVLKSKNKTSVISIAVPKNMTMEIRNIETETE